MEILKEMKSVNFSGSFPKIVCHTIFKGVLTKDIMKKMNEIMFKNGFKYHFGDYYSDWEDFTDFAPGNGKIFATVHYFGSGKPLYEWGFLRI